MIYKLKRVESMPISIIVPCYNEEESVEKTLLELNKLKKKLGEHELLFVNDGSTDQTLDILLKLENKYAQLRIVNHELNQGYGASIKTAIRLAKFDLVAITDADGTYPNSRLPELIKKMDTNDMVVGARIADDVEYPLIRKIPKFFLVNFSSWLVGRKIPDMNSGLRVFRKSIALKFMKLFPDGFSFTTTITMVMLRNRYRVEFIPISYAARVGKSKIQPIRDTLRFSQLILRTGMYFAPLRVLSPVIILLLLLFFVSISFDIFVLNNLTDKTILLLLFSMNTTMFALLADMIDKRSDS